MAAKKDEQRAALEERRLKGAYDFFDSGEYKRALQECERIIKKYGSKMGDTVHALKALALSKLGRFPEAGSVLDALISNQPTEEATLSPMVMALHETGRQDEVAPLYEAACRKCPSEEVHNSLFKLYVRDGERTKAKNVSLQLYKLTDKRTYYYTAVMLQYLSAKDASDERQKSMCYILAEKMLDRLKPNVDAEIFLEYMIYRDAARFEQALERLNDLVKKQHFPPFEKFVLLTKMQAWQEAAREAESMFEKSECLDHVWLEKRFEVGELNGEQIQDVANKLLDFIDQVPDHDKRRETILNKISILKRLEQFDKVESLLVTFYERFDGKIWCTVDLLHQLRELPEEKRKSVFESLSKIAKKDSLSWQTLEFEFGPTKSEEEQLEIISDLCNKYDQGPELERQSDTNPFDGYLELAADMAAELFLTKDNDEILLKMITTLHAAQKKSPNGFKLKLRLLWCFCAINAGEEARSMISSLNIKYLQMESLGYFFTPFLERSSFAVARPHYRNFIGLHMHSQRDIADGIVNCYKYGSFFKIEEMEELWERLDNSYELANAKVIFNLDMCITKKLQVTKAQKEVKEAAVVVPSIPWDKIRENCDMNVLPKRYHSIFPSLEIKKPELRLRWLVLNFLAAQTESQPAARAELERELTPDPSLREDLSNAFEYFVYPLIVDEEKLADRLDERTAKMRDFELKSLRSLQRFINMMSQYVLALSCIAITVQSEAAKKAVLAELDKMEKLPFNLSHLFNNEDTPATKGLRESFDNMWSSCVSTLGLVGTFLKS
ncbi:N-alpha-acetyltransferase 25, NatB auxiliary subunit [Galendromus occidentalis]|uniref:N-terminal acetyltransferase B complex subunit MDM20 homolog n=1 Tax=Galendromus occidentalis TaxID=34638 RepID=A0AAJ6QWB8_9ACAR|nr:N-alpha-acetyltransferase 25, NatB auxiliary subunit [Galendromus occidentalis]